jgi:hypothetical protein
MPELVKLGLLVMPIPGKSNPINRSHHSDKWLAWLRHPRAIAMSGASASSGKLMAD